jgi:Domain of unknown function (DUF4266)
MISRCSLQALTATEPLPAFRASLLATLLLASLGACAPVQPWERGHLAQPIMALSADPLRDAMDEHVYDSKEASSGGIGAAGGGCGCN